MSRTSAHEVLGALADPGGWDEPLAPTMAAAQGVRATDPPANGIVDRVVAEYPDDAAEPERFCRRIASALGHELSSLGDAPIISPTASSGSSGSGNHDPGSRGSVEGPNMGC